MHQVITIGSALVDVFVHTPHFKQVQTAEGTLLCQIRGDKHEIESFHVHTGGGGGNCAVGFARLGFKTAVICETGRDRFSYLVRQDFLENQVDKSLIIEEKKEQTGGSVILVSDEGERTVMVHRGASAMLDPFDIPAYWLSQAEQVHLTSIGGRLATLKKIFSIVEKSGGTSLSWNPGKKELGLLANRQVLIDQVPAQVLIVNQTEWDLISEVQQEVLQKIELVVVTAGAKGGDVYQNGEHACHFPAQSLEVVDATGAGDSFSVGFVAGLMEGKAIVEAAELGARNSASVVAYYGTKQGLLYKDDLFKKT